MQPHHTRSGVLVVESNVIVGMDLADWLQDHGYEVDGPVACREAWIWLEANTPKAAVLNFDLQSGTCVDLVRELRHRSVPLIIFSAYEQRFALPEFQDVPWVTIPARLEQIGSLLHDLLCRTQARVEVTGSILSL